jgi:TatD DNase family protein
MRFVDSHNHLQDARLSEAIDSVTAACVALGVTRCVVNGTSPSDWPNVTRLAQQYSWIVPSYGVHPWYINNLSETWRDELRATLDARPSAVGEIGIDHWKEGIDRTLQETIFLEQLAIARDRNLPVTIHGLQAWDRLLQLLTIHGAPSAGFLLHSYSGPEHLIDAFVRLGGYFSCAPSFFAHSRAKKVSVFSKVPRERLLPETDAPDQGPPAELDRFTLHYGHSLINHPGNIQVVYDGLAALVGISVEALSVEFESNFTRLFGSVLGE